MRPSQQFKTKTLKCSFINSLTNDEKSIQAKLSSFKPDKINSNYFKKITLDTSSDESIDDYFRSKKKPPLRKFTAISSDPTFSSDDSLEPDNDVLVPPPSFQDISPIKDARQIINAKQQSPITDARQIIN